ncbi:uncharacterized protein G2W53_035280 [Senna tora]|uniref:Uncharacterized protein n=1 Tax=Senna tora TaxID=362788 RepID=A0A834W3U1_9FABA|nr:uncharacterized protein G2W53_035280 [Senna tora]
MCSVRSVSLHRLLPFSIALTSHPCHALAPPTITTNAVAVFDRVRCRQEPPPTSI